jgi:hypothetical protein
VARPTAYQCVFDETVADYIISLSKTKQRHLLQLARTLAADPFVVSDYAVRDESGRDIDHLLVDAWVFAYWVDHAVREVRIVEIEEV